MSKIVKGSWDEIPHSERVLRAERLLKVLTDMSPHAVDHHFEMSRWASKTSCGTVGCAAGQCAFDSWFNRRGFGIEFFGAYDQMRFTGATPESFFGYDLMDRVFIGSFSETKTGRERSNKMIHRAVVREVKSFIADLRRRRVDE